MDIFKTAIENTNEKVMKELLTDILVGQSTQKNPVIVQTETQVWDSTRLDIHTTKQGTNIITAYECKKGRASALDLYQLIMYCDGLHEKGTPADLGVLVANQYAPDILDIIQTFSNNSYHTPLELHTWQDLTGLRHPLMETVSPSGIIVDNKHL